MKVDITPLTRHGPHSGALIPPLDAPQAARFWQHVELVEGIACWRWIGARHAEGYGLVRVGGRVHKAHRIAYALTRGPIPPETPCVLHHCDQPGCVNPDHLWLGTQADNMADKARKRRQGRRRIVRRPKKLTTAAVLEIRRLFGSCSQRALAQRFGVSQPMIHHILTGRAWR